MYKISDIKQVHIEITQRCQAACSMCDRNINGGEVNPHLDMSELKLSDIKNIFKPSFIKQLQAVQFCGNHGDPIVAEDTLEIIEYLRKHNPTMWISMNTNAGARDEKWWSKLAKTIGRNGNVIFSVDGLKDTNHLYRQNVQWDIVQRSMKAFIAAGGRARWDFLIFEHNQHQVDEAEELSQTMGFEKFVAKKTGRFITANSEKKEQHQAVDRKGNKTAELKKPDEKYQNAAIKQYDTVKAKHGSMDAYYDSAEIHCKVKDEGNLFITAEGLALPCCWTAGRMYKWWNANPKTEQIWNFVDAVGGKDAISAKKNGLRAVFETGIFDRIEESWTKASIAEGKLKVCSMKCGKEFDPFASQFK